MGSSPARRGGSKASSHWPTALRVSAGVSTSKARLWTGLLVALALVAPCGCGYDCEDQYQSTGAAQCESFAAFEHLTCTGNDLTDLDCYRDCLDGTRSGTYLCYDQEACYAQCSTDDESGCQVAYWGYELDACLRYDQYYLIRCDPRLPAGQMQCVSHCTDGHSLACADLEQCIASCGVTIPD